MQHWAQLSDQLSKILNTGSGITNLRAVGGGSINKAYQFTFGGINYFLKENVRAEFPEMFKKESNGLKALSRCKALVVPEPITDLCIDKTQFIVMKFLEKAPNTVLYSEKLGAGIAILHQNTNGNFGFEEDNYIGSLIQSNTWHKSWQTFFSTQRLHPLVKWCYDEKYLNKKQLASFERFYERINEIFPEEAPALLHGDLWGGNVMNTTGGPAVFDPAVYYGHREMDVAMSRLFGGFGSGFYEAYDSVYPLEKNYKQRIDICNLYPLLVHVKLFGKSYLNDVLVTIYKF